MGATAVEAKIEGFLKGRRFAVAGASNNKEKFGYQIFRALLDAGYEAVPIHPSLEELDGVKVFKKLADVPGEIDGVSVVTPPKVTEGVIREAKALGVPVVWMQPGAESPEALALAEREGQDVIHDACLLTALRLRRTSR